MNSTSHCPPNEPWRPHPIFPNHPCTKPIRHGDASHVKYSSENLQRSMFEMLEEVYGQSFSGQSFSGQLSPSFFFHFWIYSKDCKWWHGAKHTRQLPGNRTVTDIGNPISSPNRNPNLMRNLNSRTAGNGTLRSAPHSMRFCPDLMTWTWSTEPDITIVKYWHSII